jgi:hypothetical protein
MHVDHCEYNQILERFDADSLQGGYIASIKINTDTDVSKPLSSGGIAAVFFFYLWTAFYTPSWASPPILILLPLSC